MSKFNSLIRNIFIAIIFLGFNSCIKEKFEGEFDISTYNLEFKLDSNLNFVGSMVDQKPLMHNLDSILKANNTLWSQVKSINLKSAKITIKNENIFSLSNFTNLKFNCRTKIEDEIQIAESKNDLNKIQKDFELIIMDEKNLLPYFENNSFYIFLYGKLEKPNLIPILLNLELKFTAEIESN